MQHSAVPELAHTHTRPIHWVATATALAGVIALSSVLQPDPATAVPHDDRPRTAPAPAVTTAPDPADVTFPLDCGPVDALVQEHATGDLDGDGRPETAAVVRCDAGFGTPPSGVYVVTRDRTGKPRVVATLITPKDRLNVTEFAVRDGAVTATLLGYSSDAVPSCCPDTEERAEWRWKNGKFNRATLPEARGV